jgi:hypothetical protein
MGKCDLLLVAPVKIDHNHIVEHKDEHLSVDTNWESLGNVVCQLGLLSNELYSH